MYISLEGLIIPLFLAERSDNEVILPINLRPASQNWDAGLKHQMRGPDNSMEYPTGTVPIVYFKDFFFNPEILLNK